ncbi:MAG: TetR/AcrR family transcriptional regulator [Bacteroidales bacterium]|nr:TetR/AcrR family transcriptional regulator [Bacteroidales bacterium]
MTRKGTREMIIEVAAGLFATVGLRRTTMESIAAAAGRGRRTVYMYFRNKAEIYDAVVEMEIRHITGPLGILARSGEPLEVILPLYGEERTRRLVDLIRRNPLLIRDFAQGHSRIERLRDKLHKAEMQILVSLFSRHVPGRESSGGAMPEEGAPESDEPKAGTHAGDKSDSPTPEDYAFLFLGMLRGNDRLLTKTDGLGEAIRLSSISAWLVNRAIRG